MIKTVARILLGLAMAYAGMGHFIETDQFRAQVPPWMPAEDLVIYVSGVIEIAFGAALIFGPKALQPKVGWALAAFFVAIFPGNVSQFLTGEPAFGLDSDAARAIRLVFQPLLVAWALWSTNAWSTWRARRTS